MEAVKHVDAYNFNDINREIGNQKSEAPRKTRETQTASYIADMVLELRNLAKASQFKVLAELLEITYYEAFSCANHIEIPPGEAEHVYQLGADARKATAG